MTLPLLAYQLPAGKSRSGFPSCALPGACTTNLPVQVERCLRRLCIMSQYLLHLKLGDSCKLAPHIPANQASSSWYYDVTCNADIVYDIAHRYVLLHRDLDAMKLLHRRVSHSYKTHRYCNDCRPGGRVCLDPKGSATESKPPRAAPQAGRPTHKERQHYLNLP